MKNGGRVRSSSQSELYRWIQLSIIHLKVVSTNENIHVMQSWRIGGLYLAVEVEVEVEVTMIRFLQT